jgi:hypothetical protein
MARVTNFGWTTRMFFGWDYRLGLMRCGERTNDPSKLA